MKTLKTNKFIVYFFLLVLVSCSDFNEYRVDSEFSEYLQRFENEAQKRGLTYDLYSTGLIIEFADLKNNYAGLTHFENPIRIEVDKTYWNAISNTAGADLMKENLLFHELGHGLLNRNHLNSILENGEWKSIMCGGTKVNNRSWNINYRGIRRAYYIDELFDESTPKPEFASFEFVQDTIGINKISSLSFNSAKKEDTGWNLIDGLNYKTSLEYEKGNGRLKFESKMTDEYLVFAYFRNTMDINSDFSFELSIQYLTGDNSKQYGLIMGNTSDIFNKVNDSIEFVTINNNQSMFIGNRTWYTHYTELKKIQIKSNEKNKLKLFKIGNLLYYFVNNVYCYSTEIELTKNINNFGFLVPSNGTVWIDDFVISQRKSIKYDIDQISNNDEIEFKVQKKSAIQN